MRWTSLSVSFEAPQLDGGQDVTFYKVDYGKNAFVPEVQEINAVSNVVKEVQVVQTSTSHSVPARSPVVVHFHHLHGSGC